MQRNTSEYFYYTHNGSKHKFYPDFKINESFVEIKGVYTEADREKINQFPKNIELQVIDETNIKFYIDYCVNNYGDDWIKYDDDKPNYLTSCNKSYKTLFYNKT